MGSPKRSRAASTPTTAVGLHAPEIARTKAPSATSSGGGAWGASEGTKHLETVVALLRQHTGHDFTHYKEGTLRRRLERRAAHHEESVDDYVRRLQRSPAEIAALFKGLLIGVTRFFRDETAFAALSEKVVPRLVAASAASGTIRVWVPGCSTGEEAYSIAMLIAERLDTENISRKVTIFATDLDAAAIDAARAALYGVASAANVTPMRLARHFTFDSDGYRVSARIREMVVFAVQDVLKDPPFSRLGLVSCRNLLIYLEPELQRRLMRLFHAVLNPEGCLFLGASEAVGESADLFAQLGKRWKIYEKRATSLAPSLDWVDTAPKRIESPREPSHAMGIAALTAQMLLDNYAPACVVVDEQYDVLFLQGRTGRYLDLPAGAPRLNLFQMARGELLRELRAAVRLAAKERVEVVRERVSMAEDGAPQCLRLRVEPLQRAPVGQRLLLVTFEDAAPRHAAMEEVETSNDELRSTIRALQRTNEELSASKEELERANDELLAENHALQKKLDELERSASAGR